VEGEVTDGAAVATIHEHEDHAVGVEGRKEFPDVVIHEVAMGKKVAGTQSLVSSVALVSIFVRNRSAMSRVTEEEVIQFSSMALDGQAVQFMHDLSTGRLAQELDVVGWDKRFGSKKFGEVLGVVDATMESTRGSGVVAAQKKSKGARRRVRRFARNGVVCRGGTRIAHSWDVGKALRRGRWYTRANIFFGHE
jgi:hypothetical protein